MEKTQKPSHERLSVVRGQALAKGGEKKGAGALPRRPHDIGVCVSMWFFEDCRLKARV